MVISIKKLKKNVWNKEKIMKIVCNKEVLIQCILTVVLFYLYSYKIDWAVMPILLDDEYGYWANSSYYMGLNWTSITENIAYYSYGYSFLLVLVRIVASLFGIVEWDGIYQAALVLNQLMLIASFLIAVTLCKRYMHNMNWIVRNAVCFVVMLYPANQIYSHITMSECALTFFFWVFLYILHRVTDKPSVWNHTAIAVVSVYMYAIHQRTLAVLITVVTIIIFVKLLRISSLRHTEAFGIMFCMCFMVHTVIKQDLQNTLYMGNPPVEGVKLFSYILTKKTAVMIAAVLAVMIMLYLIEKGKTHLVITIVGVSAVIMAVYILRSGLVIGSEEAVPDRIAMNDFAGQWGKVKGIFTLSGLKRLGISILGKWFYLAAGSGLVICWGMRNLFINAFWVAIDGIKRIVNTLRRKENKTLKRLSEDLPSHIWFLGVFFAWFGTFLICAIYKEGLYKVDDLVHGRYIEFTIGILLIYSINILLSEKHWIIMLSICMVMYIAAGEYCQYVYDALQRTHYELAHAVMFGRVFWNYESPTGKIHELARYILPLLALFFAISKLFGNSLAKTKLSEKARIRLAAIRCVLALAVPLAAWTHLSNEIIDNYVCSRNIKQSGALPDIVSWINLLSSNEYDTIYFVKDSLSYKQASLLQFMLTDRVVEFVSMSDVDFDADALYVVNNQYLQESVITEKCETVRTVGSYALLINKDQGIMKKWSIYKEVIQG